MDSPFPECVHPGFGAHALDLGTARSGHQLRDLLKVNPAGQVHLPRMDLENVETSILIWRRELDLAVNPSWSQESRVQDVDSVRGHDNLDVLRGLKSVQLVEQLQHGSLDLGISSTSGLDPGRPNGVDFVHEDDGGRVLPGHDEELSNHSGALADELLDQLRSRDSDEGALRVMGHGTCKKLWGGRKSRY